ncbi:MAG: collagen binding domain-containing protein, partial [Lachnospiraceae bacterium]
MKKKWNKVMAFLLAVIIAFGDCGYCFATELREGIEESVTIEEEMESVTEGAAFDVPLEEAVTEFTEIVTDTEKAMEATKKTETADNGVSENTMEEEVYYGDQSMEEMIAILQAGRNPKEFFKYSIWTFLTVEDMVYLNRQGYTLDDMFSFLMEEADANDPVIEEMLLRFYSMDCESMTPQTYALEAESISTYAASATVTFGGDISTSALGVISAFGSKSHGTMKSIYLNGQTAFCAKYGAACSTGMTYTATSHTALGISDGQYALLKRIFSWYMKAQSINDNTLNTAITQAAFWLVLNNTWTGNAAGMASAISPLFSKTILTQSISENLFEAMVGWVNNPAEVANYDLIFWANGVNQYLVTCYYNPPAPTEYSAHVKITKTDAVNGLPVYPDATFHIYNADGTDTGATFTKNGNEYVSSTIVTTNAGSSYYVVETSSPVGYLEHGTHYPFTIEAGDSDAEKIIANSGNVFVNTPSSAYVRLTKTDEYSGAGITSSATFKIYDQDGNDTGATFTQNGNVYTSSTLYCRSEKNTYYVVETSSPAGYIPNGNRYSFTIQKSDNHAEKVITTNGRSFTNRPSSAYVKIVKTDAVTNGAIQGKASFKILDADGNDTGATFTKNGNTYTSSVIYCRSSKNTYYVVEESAPSGYVTDTKRYSFTIANTDDKALKTISNNTRGTFDNMPYVVRLSIPKVDAETKNKIVNNAVFTVHATKGNLSKPVIFTKQDDGSYLSNEIYYNETNFGAFYVTETKAPEKYYGDFANENANKTAGSDQNKSVYAFTVSGANTGQTLKITNDVSMFCNTPVKGTLSIVKQDRERGVNLAQGDATLEGAVYGLYAAEDILLPDGSKVIHTDGSLVAKLVTDENGKASVDNLYLGRYVVKEMEPSKGYTLDTTAYPINILYKDETVLEIAASQTVTEQVIKQPFQLIKVGGSEDMTEVALLRAGFQIYLVSSLEKVKDGSIKPDANGDYDVKQFLTYDFSKEETAMDYSKKPEGEPIPELFTDETGYLKSPELAYGTYVVIESTTPENYETIAPFLVKITKDSRDPQAWRVFYDKEFEAKVKVNKKDIHSSENVLKAGTEYLLYDVNNKKYVTQWVSYPTKVLYGTKEQPYTTDE